MSYFIDDATKEAEELINKIKEQMNYEDRLILSSGLSLKGKDLMIEEIARMLYDIHMSYYNDEY